MWFTSGMLYYGLSMSAESLTGSAYRDFFILIAAEIPADFMTAYSCERFGRKKTVWVNTFFASISCLAVAFIPGSGVVRYVRLLLGVLAKFSANTALNTYYLWTMELYGTELRASGLGLGNMACRIGGASAPWIAKGLTYYSRMAPYLVMGSMGVLAGGLALTLPETKGRELNSQATQKNGGTAKEVHSNMAMTIDDL